MTQHNPVPKQIPWIHYSCCILSLISDWALARKKDNFSIFFSNVIECNKIQLWSNSEEDEYSCTVDEIRLLHTQLHTREIWNMFKAVTTQALKTQSRCLGTVPPTSHAHRDPLLFQQCWKILMLIRHYFLHCYF